MRSSLFEVAAFLLLVPSGSYAALDCPDSFDTWKSWRAQTLSQPTPDAIFKTAELLRKCESLPMQAPFFQDEGLQSCFGRLRKLAALNPLILAFPDVSGSREAKADPNDPLSLPESYLDASTVRILQDSKSTTEQLRSAATKLLAKEAEAKAVIFHSAFAPIADSYVALHSRPTGVIWVHVGRARDSRDGGADPFLQTITIEKTDAGGAKHPSPVIHFAQYLVRDKLYQSTINQASCLSCHRTGAMPLLTRSKEEPKALFPPAAHAATVLEEMDREIARTLNTISRDVSLSDWGPSAGTARTRTEASLQALLGKPVPTGVSLAHVGKAMNCAKCHSSIDRALTGPISYPLLQGPLAGVSRFFILSGHMPPSQDLAPAEREVLFDLLQAEYRGDLIEWLGSPSCEAGLRNPAREKSKKPRSVPAKPARAGAS
jgi:hypothetical protein